ncbi:MAG: beta-ketoacyl-ACP reductase [Thermoprotei archaeon]|nr:MAG: beta-ketoacyl-ACP reductase [Thermoprotei archaeon]
MLLKAKRALVTGASRGIGKAIALAMAKEGAILGVNSRRLENLRETVELIRSLGGEVIPIEGDVGKKEDCKKIIEEFVEKTGGLEILVNNAGIHATAPVEELDVEIWDKILAVNLRGAYLCSKYALPYMKKARWGRIINIASMLSFIGIPERGAYAASKTGILGLTRVIALETAPYNITVNAIAPGFIETEMVKARIKEGKLDKDRLIKRIPLGRMGTPEDIAHVAVFLASDYASYITGQVIIVDGGYLAQGAP